MTPEVFKSIRLRAGLTASQLAARLRLSDGSAYIRMLERGKRNPSGPICTLMVLIDRGVFDQAMFDSIFGEDVG